MNSLNTNSQQSPEMECCTHNKRRSWSFVQDEDSVQNRGSAIVSRTIAWLAQWLWWERAAHHINLGRVTVIYYFYQESADLSPPPLCDRHHSMLQCVVDWQFHRLHHLHAIMVLAAVAPSFSVVPQIMTFCSHLMYKRVHVGKNTHLLVYFINERRL